MKNLALLVLVVLGLVLTGCSVAGGAEGKTSGSASVANPIGGAAK